MAEASTAPSTPADVLISLRDLRVDYEDVCAVRDLSLEVRAGEILGLIGPNGAGKTTTLRAVMGLIEPTYGTVLLNGYDVTEQHEQAVASVGFMPDDAPLYDDLTVYEFLDLFAASYRIPAPLRRDAIYEQMQTVDLAGKAESFTAGLSKGMKQRLMLAKTLLPNPRILLLDEPASGLDPLGRILLKNLMKRFSHEGRAVIVSSHILAELSEFCTSSAIMEKGRLVMAGRVEDLSAQVLGRAPLYLELVRGGERLAELLAANPRAGLPTRDEVGWTVPFDGGPEQAAELLAALVSNGVQISTFSRKRESLEELFLKVGSREVS